MQSGDQFAISIGEITNLVGDAELYAITLYNTTYDRQLSPTLRLTADNRAGVLTVYEEYSKQPALLFVFAGNNGSTAGKYIQYKRIMLVKGDTPKLDWAPSIADQEAEYYLALDGIYGDVPLEARDVIEQLRIPYNTNGTLQLSNSGDVIGATEVDGAYINIYTQANTSPEQRTSTVTLTLQEAPSIVRKIVVIQSGVTTYTPSVTFSQALPLEFRKCFAVYDQ